MTEHLNAQIAARLEEVAGILAEQGANPYRVRAYRRAAMTVRGLGRPVSVLLEAGGPKALEALPGIGESLARSILSLVATGRLPMLERLRGASDPVALLATIPGIGARTGERIHHDLGVDTLEELEAAAHDGRLAALLGSKKRMAGIRDSLAQRLGRVRRERPAPGSTPEPPVGELLEVDREYRQGVAAGALKTIAPHRLNPTGEAWLPVLHATRGERHYTALFSNTPRAHRAGATRDWVVLYWEGAGSEGQATVITSRFGPLRGLRIVRGREDECSGHYAAAARGASRAS